MSKLRTSALAAAVVILLVHGAVLAFRYGSATASLWGDWIDTAAPLVAAVVCWMASRQAGTFGRRVWRLVAFSALMTTVGQGLYTDYYDYLHAPLGTLWPSDVLVFFWIVPAAMTLFLSPGDQWMWKVHTGRPARDQRTAHPGRAADPSDHGVTGRDP